MHTISSRKTRIAAEYDLFGDAEGRNWAEFVFGEAKEKGEIIDFKILEVEIRGYLQVIRFTLDVNLDLKSQDENDWNNDALDLVNFIVGDSDARVSNLEFIS